jgi:catechol 2,3-dioxygenase-like lactoylglutathione lyase family enzyme
MATVRYLVGDVPRSVEFYQAQLGFEVEQEMPPAFVTGPGGKQILLDDPDGNQIELFEARR